MWEGDGEGGGGGGALFVVGGGTGWESVSRSSSRGWRIGRALVEGERGAGPLTGDQVEGRRGGSWPKTHAVTSC